tara:strand:- start:11548 stop:12270 length:723 start_codon:yes stop_codon:yes gene_type:complete
MSRANSLKGKNVLITGASRGLGRAMAFEYASKGCNIILVGRNENDLELTRSEIALSYSGNHIIRTCDLSDTNNIMTLVNSDLPNIDILVNNAGAFPISEITDMSLEEYDRCIAINVTAPFLLIKELAQNMINNSWGRIVNIASSSAYGGGPRTSVYCASKHALLGLSRSLHKELKPHNIRVICVSPGSIKTEMGKEVEKLGQDFDTFMEPSEVAEYIVFNSSFNGNLVSEELRLNRMFIQ